MYGSVDVLLCKVSQGILYTLPRQALYIHCVLFAVFEAFCRWAWIFQKLCLYSSFTSSLNSYQFAVKIKDVQILYNYYFFFSFSYNQLIMLPIISRHIFLLTQTNYWWLKKANETRQQQKLQSPLYFKNFASSSRHLNLIQTDIFLFFKDT